MVTTTTSHTDTNDEASASIGQSGTSPGQGGEVSPADHESQRQPRQDVENREAVGTQINIAKVNKLFQGADEIDEFVDPTGEFSASDAQVSAFHDVEGVARVFEIIETKRIVVVDCQDQAVTEAAVHALAHRFPAGLKRRQLLFEGRNAKRIDSLNLSMFEDPGKLKRIGSGGRDFVLIARLHSNAQTFVDSMRGSAALVREIARTLQDNGIYIVCPIASYRIRDMLKPSGPESADERGPSDPVCDVFYHWHVDFLGPCLSDAYPPKDAEYLNRAIREQQQRGLWGRGSPRDFYLLIKGFIDQGTLMHEVEKRNDYTGGSVEDFLLKINPIDVVKLFPDDPVERDVLFVATFFPNLTRPEFSAVVRILLGGRTTRIPRAAAGADGAGPDKTPVSEERLLLDLWEERDDAILAKHGLKAVTAKGGRQTIEIANPYVRSALKAHLEQQFGFYVGKQFTRIWNAGALLEIDVPQGVLDSMIALSTQLARTDPVHYGLRPLVDMVVRLRAEQSSGEEEAVRRDAEAEITARLADLIREMWSYPELRDMVRQFLNTLFETQNSDVVLDLVLRVTSRLRYSRDFDALYWIKQLLDRGQSDSHDRTVRALFDLAMQSGQRIHAFLEELAGWLPKGQVDVAKYPRSARDVLRLIAAYSLHSVERLPPADLGAWPPTYPLFASLRDDADSRKRLRFLLSSVMHPVLTRDLNDDLRQNPPVGMDDIGLQFDADLLAADFVEQWFLVLRGTEKDFADPKALGLARIMVAELKAMLSTGRRRKLLRYWQQKLDDYRAEVAESPDLSRSDRQRRKADIRSLAQLRKELKNVGIDG